MIVWIGLLSVISYWSERDNEWLVLRHKKNPDRHTDGQTYAGQSDLYLPLCFIGDPKKGNRTKRQWRRLNRSSLAEKANGEHLWARVANTEINHLFDVVNGPNYPTYHDFNIKLPTVSTWSMDQHYWNFSVLLR